MSRVSTGYPEDEDDEFEAALKLKLHPPPTTLFSLLQHHSCNFIDTFCRHYKNRTPYHISHTAVLQCHQDSEVIYHDRSHPDGIDTLKAQQTSVLFCLYSLF